MALFSRKKETSKEVKKKGSSEQKEAKTPVVNLALPTDRNISSVLIKPHVTEKAAGFGEHNIYTFVVHKSATKYDVRDAVKELFNVTPVKINIVNKVSRQSMSRSKGRKVTVKGMKKAYVYLKDGDTISLM